MPEVVAVAAVDAFQQELDLELLELELLLLPLPYW